MADQNDTSNEREFFTLAYAFDTLAQAARDHAPEAFERSADQLDMVPAALMRGVAYLSYLLSNVPDDERDTTQHHLAHSVMSELSALSARLVEHQNDVDLRRMAASLNGAQPATA